MSLNLYTYCINNPIKYWDPTGNIVTQWDIEHGIADAVQAATDRWNEAYKNNDVQGMAAAHAEAEKARQAIRNEYEIGSDTGYTYVMNSNNTVSLNSSDALAMNILSTYSNTGSYYIPTAQTTLTNLLKVSGQESVYNPVSGQFITNNGYSYQIVTPQPFYQKGTNDIQGSSTNVTLITNKNGSITIVVGSVVIGNSQSGMAYRYVSQGEYNVIMKNGYIPNTAANGIPKDIFVSPNKYGTVTEAENALQIGTKYPFGNSDSPMYRVEFKMNSVSYKYAGNVEGGTGIEMTTTEKIYVDTDKIVPLVSGSGNNNNDSGDGGSGGNKLEPGKIYYDDGGLPFMVDKDGNWVRIQQNPYGPYIFPINPSVPVPIFEPVPIFGW